MIKFFRNIRKKLLAEGNTTKYLKYAIGEILLVVIGILIALQINNTNEKSKQLKQEQFYLISLKDEFEYNKTKLMEVMARNTNYADAAQELLNHTSPAAPTLESAEFSRLILRAISSEIMYLPSNGVLQEVISSGKLDLFTNPELRKLLSSWGGVLDKVRFQETELSKYRIQLTDMWDSVGNFRQTVHQNYGNSLNIGTSKFDNDNLKLLQDRTFENNLTAFVFSSRFANKNYYSNLEEKIEDILKIINTEIK